MRSTLTSIILLFAICANAQDRIALYEEFTSETCYWSYYCDTTLWNKLNSGINPGKVQLITYITPYPGGGYLYYSDNTEYDIRSNFYHVPFVPYGRLDGLIHDTFTVNKGHVSHLQQNIIDNEIAGPSAFDLGLSCTYNQWGDSIFINVDIHCTSGYVPRKGAVKLYTAFVRTLDYTDPPGSTGQKHFENMVRRMYPSANGLPIGNTWLAGDHASITISGKVYAEGPDSLLRPHVSTPGYMVAWIQNDDDKEVAQVARAMPTGPATSLGVTNVANVLSGTIIFPNPADDEVNISFDMSGYGFISVAITDINGNTVFQNARYLEPGTQRLNIPTKDVAPGPYNVTIRDLQGIYTKTIVIKR